MDTIDLDHNRRGQLGPAQRARLEAHLRAMRAASRSLASWAVPPGFIEACSADLAEARVVSIDGHVTFEPAPIAEAMSGPIFHDKGQRVLTACQNAYVVRTQGPTPLPLAPGTVVGPGSHRLYVAPRMNLVVGAEPAAGSAGPHLLRVLFAAQRMTGATIAENRRGRMTEAQRAALAATPRSFAGTGRAIVALIMAVATCALASHSVAHGKSLLRFETVVALLATLAFLAMLPSSIAEQRRANVGTTADAADGRLELHVGPIHKSYFIRGSSIRLTLRMGELDLDVTTTPELFAAVLDGAVYRAWVAPHSGRLIFLDVS